MVISYNGGNYFKIEAGKRTILIDPTNQRSFKGADLVLTTEKRSDLENNAGPVLISHQGEYEARDVRVFGWDVGGTTIYKIDFEDLSLGALGSLNEEPDQKILEKFKKLDALIVPAGGKPALSEKEVAALTKKLEPSIIIPAFFKNLKPLLKELGLTKCDEEERLILKKKDLKPKSRILKCLKF